jgi:hypothetical protein
VIALSFALLVSCAAPKLPPAATSAADVPPFPWELAAPALSRSASAAAAAPPLTNIVRLVWDQPGRCGGWLIEQSHDLRTWQRVTNLPAPAGHDFVNLTSPPIATTAPAFFRVAATP